MAPQTTKLVNAGFWFASTDEILPVANIDANFFTHLFVGYAGVDSQTYAVTIDPSQDILIDQFSNIVKQSNSDVKTILSITAASDVFAKMAAEVATRDAFIKSSIEVARAAEFDGLDLQWLYPSSHDEMDNFESLIRSWHTAIVEDGTNLNLPPLLLVATVPNVPYLLHNVQYPIDAINQDLDWVNVISYDFYTPATSSKATGPSSAFNNPKSNALSAHFGIDSWTHQKLRPNKIVFGIPFHGWAWKLSNAHQFGVFSKAEGAAKGEDISTNGQIYYSKVKQFIVDNSAGIEKEDKRFIVSYAYSGTTWIAYESEYTIPEKIKLAKARNVLGYLALNIAADDDAHTLADAAKSNW